MFFSGVPLRNVPRTIWSRGGSPARRSDASEYQAPCPLRHRSPGLAYISCAPSASGTREPLSASTPSQSHISPPNKNAPLSPPGLSPSSSQLAPSCRFLWVGIKIHGFPSLCVFTRTVLHERASVHDKRTTGHDNPVSQNNDGQKGARSRLLEGPDPPPRGGCGDP